MRKPGAPIQFCASRNTSGSGAAFDPVPRHLQVVLARLALDGARIALHEDVAPVPTPKFVALRRPEAALVDLGAQRGEDRDEPVARQPLLGEDAEAVGSDELDELQRALDRRGRSPPVVLEAVGLEVDEDARLRVEPAEEREGAQHEDTELVLVGLALDHVRRRACSLHGFVPQIVQADAASGKGGQ